MSKKDLSGNPSKKDAIAKLRAALSSDSEECESEGPEHEKSEKGDMKDMMSKLKPAIVKVAAIKIKKA